MFIGISSGRYDVIPPDQMFVVDTDDFVIESESISVLANSNIEVICDTVQSNLIRGYRGIQASFWGSPRVLFPKVGLYEVTAEMDEPLSKLLSVRVLLLLNCKSTTILVLEVPCSEALLSVKHDLHNAISMTPYYFYRVGNYLVQLVNISMFLVQARFKLVWTLDGKFLGCYMVSYIYAGDSEPPQVLIPLASGLQSKLKMLSPF